MATLKQRLHKKNGAGGYDVLHLETSASVVFMSDGTTAEAAINDKAASVHASQHAANGSDPITPAQIGAVSKTGDAMTGALEFCDNKPSTETGWHSGGVGFFDNVHQRTGWLSVIKHDDIDPEFWLVNDVGNINLVPGNGKVMVSGNEVLHTGNKNLIAPADIGAPTLAGAGATGTWPISVSGDSASLSVNDALKFGNHSMQYFNASLPASGAANENYTPTADWWHIIRMNHGNAQGYFVDLGFCFHSRNVQFRRVAAGTDYGWTKIWAAGDAVTSAVWNDYAEYRESDSDDPGYVLVEVGDDTLTKSTERLQPFAGVSSDTWGFSQGRTAKANTPIAVAGRVLVYPYESRDTYEPGDCVCAAPGGTVSKMTREEVVHYPDRIVGTVSCVPDYDIWGGGENADRDPVSVNGRIWIKVR